jgi:hypothetical protein
MNTLSFIMKRDDEKIGIREFGKFLQNIEHNTDLAFINVGDNEIEWVFANENYDSIKTKNNKLELRIEVDGTMYHNEATFFVSGYLPKYGEIVEEDYESSYDSSY